VLKISLKPHVSLHNFFSYSLNKDVIFSPVLDVTPLKEGEVSNVLAGLESICSHVYYLAGPGDGEKLFAPTGYEGSLPKGAPTLTPNSVNIHGSLRLKVAKDLFAGGLGEVRQKPGLLSFLVASEE
jgi:hypothetical protein